MVISLPVSDVKRQFLLANGVQYLETNAGSGKFKSTDAKETIMLPYTFGPTAVIVDIASSGHARIRLASEKHKFDRYPTPGNGQSF